MAPRAVGAVVPRAHLRRLVDIWRRSRAAQRRLWGLVTAAFGFVTLKEMRCLRVSRLSGILRKALLRGVRCP